MPSALTFYVIFMGFFSMETRKSILVNGPYFAIRAAMLVAVGIWIFARTHIRHTRMTFSLTGELTDGRSQWWQSVAVSLFFEFESLLFYCLTLLHYDFSMEWVVNAQKWLSLRICPLLYLQQWAHSTIFKWSRWKSSARIRMSHWHRGRVVVLAVTHVQRKSDTNCRQSRITFHSKKMLEA